MTQPDIPPAPPCVLVIFGARGDLTKRLLIPSIYNLALAGRLDDGFRILGVDHSEGDDAELRKTLSDFIHALAKTGGEFGGAAIDPKAWGWVEQRLSYLQGDFEDPTTYAALGHRLERLGGKDSSALFYLATAPRFFGEIPDQLDRAGLTRPPQGGFRRVVVEKPFGVDLASAKALNRRLAKTLTEDQIYRIDHFLGKETVRNILVTRFGNGVFEPLWSRLHIDHVQITAAETVGVERRGGYYDKAGALRDMVPSHLFQLLALTAMEPPNSFGADDIRAESAKTVEAIARLTKGEAVARSVRGQYQAGAAGGRDLIDYRKAPDVAPDSRTETYVALKLEIDNWRWAGVPFYLRTGKALSGRDTEIAIQFKCPPKALFGGGAPPNVLVLQLQPDEGISLQFEAKQPGPDVRLAPVAMDFKYADYFKTEPATGYETLIYDSLIGDQTLFKRADDIEFAWAAVMPFLEAWKDGGEVEAYAAGSDGPAGADRLIAVDGRRWRPIGAA
jgi:glucose-6-phosphate 1-dehydrogenase